MKMIVNLVRSNFIKYSMEFVNKQSINKGEIDEG